MQSQTVHPAAPAGPPQPQLQPQGAPAGLEDEPEKACLKTQRSPNTLKTWQKPQNTPTRHSKGEAVSSAVTDLAFRSR